MKRAHPERMPAPDTQSSTTEQVTEAPNLSVRMILQAIIGVATIAMLSCVALMVWDT
jgi:hypothetical protein